MAIAHLVNDFACLLCGNCCRGPGVVRLTPPEEIVIANWLEMAVEEFDASYIRRGPPDEIWLQDQPGPEQECIFLNLDNTCRIHPVKPQQCRDFPTKWRTRDIMEYCEGMSQS